jgi:hypothetical protein
VLTILPESIDLADSFFAGLTVFLLMKDVLLDEVDLLVINMLVPLRFVDRIRL